MHWMFLLNNVNNSNENDWIKVENHLNKYEQTWDSTSGQLSNPLQFNLFIYCIVHTVVTPMTDLPKLTYSTLFFKLVGSIAQKYFKYKKGITKRILLIKLLLILLYPNTSVCHAFIVKFTRITYLNLFI